MVTASPTAFAVIEPSNALWLIDASNGIQRDYVTGLIGDLFFLVGSEFVIDAGTGPGLFNAGVLVRHYDVDAWQRIDDDGERALRWIVDRDRVFVTGRARVDEDESESSSPPADSGGWLLRAFDVASGVLLYETRPPAGGGFGIPEFVGFSSSSTAPAEMEVMIAEGTSIGPGDEANHEDEDEVEALTFYAFDRRTGVFLRSFPGPMRYSPGENPSVARLGSGDIVIGIPGNEADAARGKGQVLLLDGATGQVRRRWIGEDEFGTSIAVTPRDVIVVGQPRDENDHGKHDRGLVEVFDPGADEPVDVLRPPTQREAYFGESVAASDDRILVTSTDDPDDAEATLVHLFPLALCTQGECGEGVTVAPDEPGPGGGPPTELTSARRLRVTCPALTDHGGRCEGAAYAADGTQVTPKVRRKRRRSRPTVLTLKPNAAGRRLLRRSPPGELDVSVRVKITRGRHILAQATLQARFKR